MSQMDIDRVLSQIRSLSSSIRPQEAAKSAVPQTGGAEFANLLKQGVDQVNQAQQSASTTAAAFERGVAGVELPQVMLEMQKASVSFRALTEVRNRLVNAYQEIMNMPI
jgi:flagellar hook-basal body complex protein FliE